MRKSPTPWLVLLALTCACAGGPESTPDAAIESRAAERRAQLHAKAQEPEPAKILVTLDKLMDKYVEAVMASANPRREQLAESLRRTLRETVDKYFDVVVHIANDDREPANRAIAVGALGFAGGENTDATARRGRALESLLNALVSKDELTVRNSIFGIGQLRHPNTPVVALARVLEDDDAPLKTRVGASYSLMNLQTALVDPGEVMPVWLHILKQPIGSVDPAILVHALRGLGLSRDKKYSDVVEPFAKHPTPFVRCAAAVALGRLGDQDSHEKLLDLIGTSETNPNVRLYARKALQALAGNIDRGYDVAEWRRLFERGN